MPILVGKFGTRRNSIFSTCYVKWRSQYVIFFTYGTNWYYRICYCMKSRSRETWHLEHAHMHILPMKCAGKG